MTPARLRALGFALVVLAAAAFAFAQLRRPPASAQPTLLLLTSLPLVFSEDFSLKDNGSFALKALRSHYRVIPISVTSSAELAKGRLLLIAQPLAQPAENLVALDDWVQGGGRLLLLADPMLEWPSNRPLGDPLAPPAMFMDTGLLAHWSLRLDGPDRRGAGTALLGGREIATMSAGSLHGGCKISADGAVAHCRLGKGRATIVADADLLDVEDLGHAAGQNMDAVLSELDALK